VSLYSTSLTSTDMASYCNDSLFNFTGEELDINKIVTGTLESLAILTSLFVVLFILCQKLYHHFVYRLTLYLMIANTLSSIAMIMESVPVTYTPDEGVGIRAQWEGACSAIAYISQMTQSVKLTIICWITLYLLILAMFKVQINKRKYEVCGLLVTLVVPVVKDWVPLAWDMYGLTGMWCWIRLLDIDCIEKYTLGILLMFIVEHGPVFIMTGFTIVTGVTILVKLYKDAAKARISTAGVTDTSTLKAGLPLLMFPLVYSLIFLFRSGYRIYYIAALETSDRPFTNFWIGHAGSMGVAAIIVPLGFTCYPNTLRALCKSCTRKPEDTRPQYLRESWSDSKELEDSTTETQPILQASRQFRDSIISNYQSVLTAEHPTIY